MPALEHFVAPEPLTLLVLECFEWASSHRGPPSVGFGGVVYGRLPLVYVEHWLDRRMVEDGPFRRHFEDLVRVADGLWLEEVHRKKGDDET